MAFKIWDRAMHCSRSLATAGLVGLAGLAVTAAAATPTAGPPQASAPAANSASSPTSAACPALLNHTFLRLQDEKPQSLCQYQGKVVLVVNTASFCGFTQQYEALEALYARHQSRGLVVLGFPSNDFSQETGSNKDIADFCSNTFGVKFPMFSKSSVRGPQANPLFQQLAKSTGTEPRWNFYKYLISRDTRTVQAFNSLTDPAGKAFAAEVEKRLQAP